MCRYACYSPLRAFNLTTQKRYHTLILKSLSVRYALLLHWMMPGLISVGRKTTGLLQVENSKTKFSYYVCMFLRFILSTYLCTVRINTVHIIILLRSSITIIKTHTPVTTPSQYRRKALIGSMALYFYYSTLTLPVS